MKVKIMGYEVSVNCKEWYEDGYNKKSTYHFLNDLSILLSESSKWNREQGYNVIADKYEKESADIFVMLKNIGFYGKAVH